MAYQLQSTWTDLVGQWVEIREFGRALDQGIVDAATEDSQILWLASYGVAPRRMVVREEHTQAWADSGVVT